VEKTVDDYMAGNDKSAASDFDYAANKLRVEVWVDKPTSEIYRKGEELGVGFQTNQDAYAVVYRIDAEGLVTVLWPRGRLEDGFVFGGHEYGLPIAGARPLTVSTVEGEGLVQAIVSQYPFDLRALDLDFHHEPAAERYDFRVAGDPFLAMNEVNFAVTGLEDSGEYVVTNHTTYYVHQVVDHPRYLCNQCHVDDDVSYDPYRDDCTLTIRHDYTWYNNWYDRYGYYPVYGNPVYVYIDPWTYSPWVNYWYRPAYACAPWYGWGWGWGASYSWGYSPYYQGDSYTWYDGGHRRYRPLDRTRANDTGMATKLREYAGGSEMVRKSAISDRERGAMLSRTRLDSRPTDRTVVGARGQGRDVNYRGADPVARTRTNFARVDAGQRSQTGLRIRDNTRLTGTTRDRGTADTVRRRHTAAGNGRAAGLVPVERDRQANEDWRGTTRGGGVRDATTVGNNRSGTGDNSAGTVRGRTGSGVARDRSNGGSKAVQPRKQSPRVWNSTGGQTESPRGSSRSRSGNVERRSRDEPQPRRDSGAVSPRRQDSGSSGRGSTEKSSGAVQKSSGSGSRSDSKAGSSSGSSRGGGGTSKGGSRGTGGRDKASRR
jgi:hypothetical protein